MKITMLVFALYSSGFFSAVNAQSLEDMGKVEFTIRSTSGSSSAFAPADYVSSMDNGNLPNMSEVPDQHYTEIIFGREQQREGKTID